MELIVDQEGQVTLVAVGAVTLDAANVKEFKRAMEPLLAEHDRMVLDMGRLEFVDSAGLGALISCLRVVSGRGGDLKLFNVTKRVRVLFELVRLHRLFEILNTREEALASYQE